MVAVAPAKPNLPAKRAVLRAEPATRPAPASKVEAARTRVASGPSVGVLQFAILPWGEVFVNGKSRGVSPPLRSIELPSGTYTVEVRNTSFPTHSRRVQVRPSEPVRIRHRFR